MKYLTTPIDEETVAGLYVGDVVFISGWIYTGRDAVLPKVQECIANQTLADNNIDLQGSVIFHTAVSPAGIGPTSSNKKEIEDSFGPLSAAGVKLHLGKGAISKGTVELLKSYNSVFAVIPPTTALFESRTFEREVVGWPELGMEALHRIRIHGFQAIIAAAHGESIY
ncbi:fumarate hydratase C-terminal domain-containing protein [Bacteroides sp.]|uniref:fumarate hydratase C-terminal domain-containing protein n=1 Tax=Bacteroides sp. TaxID=29523 RepID=UPI003AB13AED